VYINTGPLRDWTLWFLPTLLACYRGLRQGSVLDFGSNGVHAL